MGERHLSVAPASWSPTSWSSPTAGPRLRFPHALHMTHLHPRLSRCSGVRRSTCSFGDASLSCGRRRFPSSGATRHGAWDHAGNLPAYGRSPSVAPPSEPGKEDVEDHAGGHQMGMPTPTYAASRDAERSSCHSNGDLSSPVHRPAMVRTCSQAWLKAMRKLRRRRGVPMRADVAMRVDVPMCADGRCADRYAPRDVV